MLQRANCLLTLVYNKEGGREHVLKTNNLLHLAGHRERSMSRHKGHRRQLKSFVTHTAIRAVLGAQGNRLPWARRDAPRGLTRVKVLKFPKDRAVSWGSVLQKCVWAQLEPPLLAIVLEHCKDQPCGAGAQEAGYGVPAAPANTHKGRAVESHRLLPNFLAFPHHLEEQIVSYRLGNEASDLCKPTW